MEQGGVMTDRELLELAAKAAGFNFKWFKVKQWKNMKGKIGPYRYFTGTVDVYGSHHTKPWNPLTDDGDALRLAVKLHMQVSITTESCRAETLPVLGVRVNDNDEFAATRRAIVMAAANAWADKP